MLLLLLRLQSQVNTDADAATQGEEEGGEEEVGEWEEEREEFGDVKTMRWREEKMKQKKEGHEHDEEEGEEEGEAARAERQAADQGCPGTKEVGGEVYQRETSVQEKSGGRCTGQRGGQGGSALVETLPILSASRLC